MNRAEYLGAQLVMEIRRQADHLAAWQASEDKINALYDEIRAMGGSEVYAHTGEIPAVPADSTYAFPRLVTSAPGDAVTETMNAVPPSSTVRMDDGTYRWIGARMPSETS